MKPAKILGLAALAAMALIAFAGAGSASATVLCKTTANPCGAEWDYPKGTEIHAVLVAGTTSKLENLSGSSVYTTCTESTIQGTTSNTGSDTETVTGSGVLTWGPKGVGCSTTVDTLANGTLEVHYGEKGDGVVTSKGAEWTEELFGVTCSYGTAATGTKLGTLTEPASSTSDTVLDVSAEVEKKAGGFLCPSEVRWTAEYTFTSPVPLYVATS
jgi:hypothetical protein